MSVFCTVLYNSYQQVITFKICKFRETPPILKALNYCYNLYLKWSPNYKFFPLKNISIVILIFSDNYEKYD